MLVKSEDKNFYRKLFFVFSRKLLLFFQGIKSIVDAKESELDSFKARGDDITAIGNSKLVNLYENDLFKRWNELEDKIRYIQATLEIKLKEIERIDGAPPAKQRVIEQEEVFF